ncbi:MAG: class I tRNA ligase family protein, partial [Candidatus Jordarchaeaceae archaeon]
NISRQIVWGIRIPAWQCDKCFEWNITDGRTPKNCKNCGHENLTQDLDTFDTWFSSSQWPYATLLSNSKSKAKIRKSEVPIGIASSEDFDYFYPTSVMETGYDILPFWVIRMIMLGLYATGEVPFKEVLLHGLVRDAKGEKISKSKGNVIDPIEMAEKYGADALRMGLIWGTLIENDIALSEDNIRGQRNFSNKIWNIARFMQLSFEGTDFQVSFYPEKTRGRLSVEDKLILQKLKNTISGVTKNLNKYRLSEAAELLYKFIWNELADKYLESIKRRPDKTIALSVFRHVLLTSLILLHPFMPFVTEAVWQEVKSLRKYPEQPLIVSSWPKAS